MTSDPVERRAQLLYETLAAKGHGPRPWAAPAKNFQAWDTLPPTWRDEYRDAIRALDDSEFQLTLAAP